MFTKLINLIKNPFHPWLVWCLLLINMAGSVYGFYWYRYQIAITPWYYLIFVPDSPLSSSLFSFVLISLLIKKRCRLLEQLACVWTIKYGIWAVIINISAGYIHGQFSFENWLLSTSHLGMAIEGAIFLPQVNITKTNILLVGVWLIVNDYVDYALGQHPYLFASSQFGLACSGALVLSVLLTIVSIVQYRRRKLLP